MSTFLLKKTEQKMFSLKISRSKLEAKLSGYMIQAKCN